MTLTYEEYLAKPRSFQIQWERMLEVVSRMRGSHVSLPRAAREIGIRPEAVVQLGGAALKRLPGGRYVAKPFDKLLRVLLIPSEHGLREVAVPDSHQASRIGEYWNAVEKYLSTGDYRMLVKGRWKIVIDSDGNRIRLLTDLTVLRRQASAGVLHFESLYGRRA